MLQLYFCEGWTFLFLFCHNTTRMLRLGLGTKKRVTVWLKMNALLTTNTDGDGLTSGEEWLVLVACKTATNNATYAIPEESFQRRTGVTQTVNVIRHVGYMSNVNWFNFWCVHHKTNVGLLFTPNLNCRVLSPLLHCRRIGMNLGFFFLCGTIDMQCKCVALFACSDMLFISLCFPATENRFFPSGDH